MALEKTYCFYAALSKIILKCLVWSKMICVIPEKKCKHESIHKPLIFNAVLLSSYAKAMVA